MKRVITIKRPNPAYKKKQEQERRAESKRIAEQKAFQQRLMQQMRTAYDAAKQQNEGRYEQLLDLSSRYSGQQRTDIQSSYADASARAQQQLIGQGLGSTTVPMAIQTGYQREMQNAMNRAGDLRNSERMRIIEGRTDAYPDMGFYAQLSQMYGSGG